MPAMTKDVSKKAIFAEANVAEASGIMPQLRMTRKPADVTSLMYEALRKVPLFDEATQQQITRFVEATELCRLQPRQVWVRRGATNEYG